MKYAPAALISSQNLNLNLALSRQKLLLTAAFKHWPAATTTVTFLAADTVQVMVYLYIGRQLKGAEGINLMQFTSNAARSDSAR